MMDLADDVEAQQSLLPTIPDENDQEDNSSASAVVTNLRSVILLMHSAFRFQGQSYYSSSPFNSSSHSSDPGVASPTSTPYAPVRNAAVTQDDITVDSEIVEAVIELQYVQRENIADIVKKKNLNELRGIGLEGVADALNTDLSNGIKFDHHVNTEAIPLCKTNELSQAFIFFHLFKEECNSYTIFLLSLAAVLSLAVGIYQDGPAIGWYDGVILILALFVLIVSTAIHCYWQARSYRKRFHPKQWFSESRESGKVEVIRGGGRRIVHSSDLCVGDIVCLHKGYQVPADGIFVVGEALQLDDGLNSIIDDENPFIFYGSRVISGHARMIVTSVGMDTVWGEEMSMAMESSEKKCKFEVSLHKLSVCEEIVGLILSILIIIVMFLRNLLGKGDNGNGSTADPIAEPTRLKTILDVIKGIIKESKGWGRVLLASLNVSLLGILVGIPSVIAIAVSRQSLKVLADKASEKLPLACFKMASVTTICTDAFGGLTERKMEVDGFFVDEEFVSESSILSPNVMESLCDGIGISSLLSQDSSDLKDLVLISWAKDKFGLKPESLRNHCSLATYEESCNFLQECSQAIMLKTTDQRQERSVHFKGPPLDILSMCSAYYSIEGEIKTMDDDKRGMFKKASEDMLLGRELIAYACKRTYESTDMSLKPDDLIFVGMIGLRNINQDEIRNAVLTLREGGVRTILVSGEDTDVLRSIANKYELDIPESSAVLTGEEFRNLTDIERMQKVETICIMAGCTIQDKALLVKCLREKDQVVAMLGQRVNDCPALKGADIGLALGSWSSEIARDCSEIIIWNGDFTFLLNLIRSGRCVYENIRRFIQLELVIIISSSAVNFIATVERGDSPITVIEFFWLSLVVAILGGVALLTEQQRENLMNMPPVKSLGLLITKAMWRNIALQASYQTAICLILLLKGGGIFGISTELIEPMICNTLFLCQLFEKFIAREPEKRNIFKGLNQNTWFWVALLLFIICQAAMVAAENAFSIRHSLNWKLWASCILFGLVSWPLDFAGKFASDFITGRFTAD